jgi:hypothetical protein
MVRAFHPFEPKSIRIRDYIHLLRTTPSLVDARCPACEQPLAVNGDLDPMGDVGTAMHTSQGLCALVLFGTPIPAHRLRSVLLHPHTGQKASVGQKQ